MRTTSTLWLCVVAATSVACSVEGGIPTDPTDSGTTVDRPVATDQPVAVDRPVTTDVAIDRPSADVVTDRPATTDRPSTDVTMATDRPSTDVTMTTDRPSADVPVDVPPATNTCATTAIIDLNTAGTRSGETVRYVGTTVTAPERGTLPAPCGTSDHYQVALRYTPRANARLRISTANPGTAMSFDSVVWVQAACAPLAMGNTGLGCNDDGGQMPNTYASLITASDRLTAGTAVFILVGGYGTGMANRGAFELTVTELAEVAVGAACNPAMNSCVAGSSCLGATGMQRCVADGTSGGRCRTVMGMTTACDSGLTCSSGTCQSAIPVGMPCGGSIVAPCITGSSCQGGAGAQRCTADGTAGGRCRMVTMTAPACDATLTCTSSRCVATVAVGGACDITNAGQVCAMGASCAPMGTTTATTCQRDSTAAGTPCNDAAPLCATALTCDGTDSSGVCRRAGTAMGACDLRFNSVACPMGTGCLGTSATAAVCASTRMETEPNNTVMAPQAAISMGAVFTGSLGVMTDAMDCYGVTVPANGTVTVETSVPGHPGCDSNDTVATLFTAAGVEVTRNDDGSNRGLCSFFSARTLAAGGYVVCVRTLESTPTTAYNVSIGVYGP